MTEERQPSASRMMSFLSSSLFRPQQHLKIARFVWHRYHGHSHCAIITLHRASGEAVIFILRTEVAEVGLCQVNLRQVVEAVLTLLRFSACLKTVRHGRFSSYRYLSPVCVGDFQRHADSSG